ncbi:enoyl-CoA hydratase [Bacillus pseudomycoides]|uniref:Enoyl-CoA hydratase n=1 Tax=Bacillus pseudomycoides TaxID=64104 RepID=A0ABD6T6V6_9BACI|nr:enoyl-CoA hydratase [Bacillus pseudomycoides]EEM12007.1 Enoyl-CoA hydratase/isomerase [Bacillus pseudomycoides]PEP86439.1 enoyl-CoA hydratase [Bacillus pseudomycoides]PGF06885.1 enoyl-CoA hydratase [Bacillus pseudomycoides]PHE97565.1 enoyl-CoA hydratase [Bacillus pseudomycoides]
MRDERVVICKKKGSIAVITIQNPPVNTLSLEVVQQLLDVLEEIEIDNDITVVIITGIGEKAFVAGGDIKEFPDWMGKGGEYAEMKSLKLQQPLNQLGNLSKPTIAAINGLALGGGCELALACDLRVIEEQVSIGLPEITLGLFPGAGGTQRLPRLIGEGKAKEMMFTGKPITAKEAKEIGLVNYITPRGKALNTAKEIAKDISKFSLPALSYMKLAIREGAAVPLQKGLEIEARYFGKVFQTEDVKEGVKAFIEKRIPHFTNR